ncbi:hypothetical protein [Jiangella asiatica]|uniref:hypothetical protein n=1 Tax=Jiangella asiatica TaxID=2530372 RepID=UPI0013A5F012|nr:hypothetical protein [Jiangella asiatica]
MQYFRLWSSTSAWPPTPELRRAALQLSCQRLYGEQQRAQRRRDRAAALRARARVRGAT